jgi:signal transduction histidine kinase
MNLQLLEKPRLLIVDDEDSIRRVCQRTLASLACGVDTAPTAEEALRLFKAQAYDVVITDLAMPGRLDGRALLEEIKRLSPLTDVVVMTAFPALENAIPILKQGAYDYLIKPFTPDLLRSVVTRCLDKRRLSDDLCREKRLRQDLEAAYGQLQEMEQLKEAFLARVNHELRIPLAPALMALELLAGSLADPEHQTLCGVLRERLKQLQSIVESVLLFSALKKPEYVCPKTLIDIRHLLSDVIETCRSLAEEKEVSVHVDLQRLPETLLGNTSLLDTLFKNLFINAVQFNQKGGTIQVVAQEVSGQIEISFADTGRGIPAAKLSQVFDSFYQVANYLTRDVGGMGLGLALARRIAELHGGSIQVNSEEGRGSTFKVILPGPFSSETEAGDGHFSRAVKYADK